MKNFRIAFTEMEPCGPGGSIQDVWHSTKWMDEEEFEAFYSAYQYKQNAHRVYRS